MNLNIVDFDFEMVSQACALVEHSLSEEKKRAGFLPEFSECAGLVSVAVEVARERGKKFLGVDYETMNPAARSFWKNTLFRTQFLLCAALIDRNIEPDIMPSCFVCYN